MHVHIDQSGRYILALEFDGLSGIRSRDLRGNTDNAVLDDGDVHHPVDAMGRVDEMPAFQQQIIRLRGCPGEDQRKAQY